MRGGYIRGVSLSADSAHLVAVSAGHGTIIISDILSGNILQTLADEGSWKIFISPDGSLLASASSFGARIRLWSTTRGTLLATLDNPWDRLAFSHTNRLYMTVGSGGGSVCAVLAERNRPVNVVPFSFPAGVHRIIVAPKETQVAFQIRSDTQVWSLNHFGDACDDSYPHSILAIDLSSDGSLLAIRTQTEIEVWDARIDRCRYIIRSKATESDRKCIAFSPRGELVVSSSPDGIIVIDVQTGIIRPTTYSRSQDVTGTTDVYGNVGISFDCSIVSALGWREGFPNEPRTHIWDLPSGTLLYEDTISYHFSRWSQIDLYMRFYRERYDHFYDFNVKTLQVESLPNPGDHYRKYHHLRREGNMLRIRSPRRRKDHLFLALPSHLVIKTCCCRGDRVCILSEDGRLLLLDVSGLAPYMKEFCDTESELGGELCADPLKFVAK